jgi:cellulose synthase/poly-beta-1,6-N-acetylglucosamine synthase-like glycosyltransferase
MINPVPKHERKWFHKLFEKVPAMIFMGALIFLIFGGLVLPEITAYIIIVLNVFFFYKSASLTITFILSYLKLRQAENVNWRDRLDFLDDKKAAKEEIQADIENIKKEDFSKDNLKKFNKDNFITRFNLKLPTFIQRIIFKREKQKVLNYLKKELKKLENLHVKANWHELQHIIIIPHVKEPEHILRATLENLRKQTFPLKQINVVLAAEARDPDGLPLSKKLAAVYKDVFNNVWVSNHILKDEEIVGKSSNMKAGGEVAYAKVQELGWDMKKTLITSCDADSKIPEQYFSYVSLEYVTRDNAEYKFFNGTMVFYNNIWRLPFYARVKNSMSTLYNTARLVRTDKLIPFSTYTTSFWVIQQIGFWTPWVTPEDFHLFFKAQFKLGDRVSVVPIFLRIMSDAAEGQGHIDTIKNNYKQERRWSWGISDDGWILQNVLCCFWKLDFIVIYRALHSVFDHIMSPLLGVMLIVGGNIPPLINPRFNSTVLGSQLPEVSSTIITLSLFSMIILVLMDAMFKPKRKGVWTPLNFVVQLTEWLVLPVASFVLAVLPGLEANTRLLFGKHLEYYVTKKQ